MQKYPPVVARRRAAAPLRLELTASASASSTVGRSAESMHEIDLERLELVAVRAVGLALVVLVVQFEQPAAVALLGGGERRAPARATSCRSTSPRLTPVTATPRVERRPAVQRRDRVGVELGHQRVEGALGVAVVVEGARSSRRCTGRGTSSATPRSPALCCRLASSRVGVRVGGAVEHRGAHGVGEQRRPRRRRARCRS